MDAPKPDAGPKDPPSHSRISPQTLIIASVASAAASFAVARIWGPGTLLGAAAAPVIVALVSESLRRPVRTVAATAKRAPTGQSKRRGRRLGREVNTPRPPTPPTAATERAANPAPRPTRSAGPDPHARRRHWGLALATGLAAFSIVVAVYTVPDLIAGNSITGNGQPTTFFGGASTTSTQSTTSATATTAAPATVTKTAPITVTTTASSSTTTTTTTARTVSRTTPSGTQSVTTTTSTPSTTATTATTIGVPTTAAP